MNNKIKRFSVFLSLLIVVLCSITLLTSCDKDIEKTMNAKVTLRENGDRFFVKFYPDNTKSQFIEIDIPKRLNAQNIDLTQQGDWKVIGLAVSYTHLTLPTTARRCRSRWSPYH